MNSDFEIKAEILGNRLYSKALNDPGVDSAELSLARRQSDGRLRLRPLLYVGAAQQAHSTRRGAPGLLTPGEICIAINFEIVIICGA